MYFAYSYTIRIISLYGNKRLLLAQRSPHIRSAIDGIPLDSSNFHRSHSHVNSSLHLGHTEASGGTTDNNITHADGAHGLCLGFGAAHWKVDIEASPKQQQRQYMSSLFLGSKMI